MPPLLTASLFQFLKAHPAEAWGIALVIALAIAVIDRVRAVNTPCLKVDSARWVCTTEPNKFFDVKGVVEGSIVNGRSIKIQASDQLLGDPCPGHPKCLEVKLTSGETIIVDHNGWLKR
jgi:hypothetical protein